MAVSAFIMCFTILLKAVCSETKPTAMVSSHYAATLTEYADVSTCEWNCVISNKDFSKEMKKLITETKMVTLDVKYDEKVGERCLHQNNTKTLSKPELWIWLTARSNNEAKQSSSYSSSTSAPKLFADNILFEDFQEGYKEVNVRCDFEPTTRDARSNASGSFDNRLIALLLIQGIANNSVDLHNLGSLCYAETKHNPYICLNISKTGNNSETELDFGNKMFHFAVRLTANLILVIFGLYSPAILCLFPATEVINRHGARQIIVEGPSPVGVRNLVAKFLHPEKETIWRKILKFMLLIAVFPALIQIAPGGPFLRLMFHTSFLICSYIGYVIWTFCRIFFPTKSLKKKNCFACRFVRREACFNQGELLKLIISHLGVQTLLLANCWKLFTGSFFKYVQIVSLVFPVFELSVLTFFQGFLFISVALTIPLVTIILILRSIMTFIFGVTITTPSFSLAGYDGTLLRTPKISRTARPIYFITLAALEMLVYLLAGLGTFFMLDLVALNVGIVSLNATIELVKHSTDSLPYVAYFVIVFYYLWSCYSSFVNKYRDLALTLYKKHKRSCNQLQQRQDLDFGIEPTEYNEEEKMRIPKDLFDIACEKLLPVGKTICIVLLKVVLILVFVFLVFSTIMAVPDATSTTKAMVAFFTGSFPKVIFIFFDGGRNKNLKNVALEEKVTCIVNDYVTRRSTSDQVNNEEELVLTNPDSTELSNLV